MNKIFRVYLTLVLALGWPLAAATTAFADNTTTLAEAQLQLEAAQQELADARVSLDALDLDLATKLTNLQAAQTAVTLAQTSYDASEVVTTTTTPAGVKVDVYRNISRTPAETDKCASFNAPSINFSWGTSGPSPYCPVDNFTVKFTGTITAPIDSAYRFMGDADDGFMMTIDGVTIINDWYDKGGGGTWSYPVTWTAGSTHTFTAVYYENGGGAKIILNGQTNSGPFIVPSSWFGQTTTTTSTKDPALLTILQEKQSLLATAQSEYDAAFAAQAQGQIRLNNAIALVATLEHLVYDLTPRLAAPTNLTATLTDTAVELTWTAPTPNLSNTLPERYAIMWSTTNFT